MQLHRFDLQSPSKAWRRYADRDFDQAADPAFPVVRSLFSTSPVDRHLRMGFLAAIETLAQRRGIPYQRLRQHWLREKLAQEAPDLAVG